MTQLVIFPYSEFKTEDLANLAKRIIPPSLPPRAGKSEERMRSYFAGRAALFSLFRSNSRRLFVAPNQEFGFLESYNLAGQKESSVYVNLSHTAEIAVAVYSEKVSVGIDIELASRSAERVMARVCTEREIAWAEEKKEFPVPRGIFLWSAKEAFSKALGLGMKFGMKALEIKPGQRFPLEAATTLPSPIRVESPRIYLERYQEYIITICIDDKNNSARIERRILSRRDFEVLR